MPEVNGLYPTPRRKRFVESVEEQHVYSQYEGETRQSYFASPGGGKCTELADQCERAGWIEPGKPLTGPSRAHWWQLTDLGRQVKDGIKKEAGDG
jgi:hypothetical protein